MAIYCLIHLEVFEESDVFLVFVIRIGCDVRIGPSFYPFRVGVGEMIPDIFSFSCRTYVLSHYYHMEEGMENMDNCLTVSIPSSFDLIACGSKPEEEVIRKCSR